MIGESVGNFVVESRLGRGGMGDVYLARHKTLDTVVAVKVLNAAISENHEQVQRFFNEARIAGRIKHAGTIKIFDSGFIDGNAYLVMELLEGESLAKRVERGPLPEAQVIDLSRQVASVLDATHRAGVIHRDLKPDNIFVVTDDERDSRERVKVLDFGIAKLSGGTLAAMSPKTSGTMGTPAYMAPEQWGDSGQVDWRADAYSLGCVMFELACGRPPFLARSIPEAYTKHAHAAPPSPRSLVPTLSVELDALILRLLSKEPSERAVSMGQILADLDAIGEASAEAAAPAPVIAPPIAEPVRAAPTVQPFTAVSPPMPTQTTLGGSAAALEAVPPPRRRMLGAGIAAGAIAIGAIVVVIALSRSHGSDTPAPAPTAAPPPPIIAAPTPPPAAPMPAPAAIVIDAGAPLAAIVPPAPEASIDASVPAVTLTPRPHGDHHPKHAASGSGATAGSAAAAGSAAGSAAAKPGSGSAVKPGSGSGSDDDQWGGRL